MIAFLYDITPLIIIYPKGERSPKRKHYLIVTNKYFLFICVAVKPIFLILFDIFVLYASLCNIYLIALTIFKYLVPQLYNIPTTRTKKMYQTALSRRSDFRVAFSLYLFIYAAFFWTTSDRFLSIEIEQQFKSIGESCNWTKKNLNETKRSCSAQCRIKI